MKRSNWEGGVRVPLFWYWKGKIRAGGVSNQMVSNYDLLNTIAEITGQEQLKSKDGMSYAPILFGNEYYEGSAYTVFSSFIGPALVTAEGWKLRYFQPKHSFQLYYLPNDYKEEYDLATKYPKKVQKLKGQLVNACDGNLENGLFSWGKTAEYE